ncbi:coat protein [Euonymus yellow vein virus]|uniref:Coat protein n=3 Tax=Euonymus yellow vein virus TaxID=2013968 RepID=A0A218MK30_9VIRU|nr:coat protein [Euonymus yellow vein virus]ASE06184.1 coat protein [Euonymus yellow vein virus]
MSASKAEWYAGLEQGDRTRIAAFRDRTKGSTQADYDREANAFVATISEGARAGFNTHYGATHPPRDPNARTGTPPAAARRARRGPVETGPNNAEEVNGESMTSQVNMKFMEDIKYHSTSNNVADSIVLENIAADWKSQGLPPQQCLRAAIELTRYFADVGASEQTDVTGQGEGIDLEREVLAATVASHCTIRQFCSYYAKVVWNMMIYDDVPPANWARFNFPHEQRFAGFDFFEGVLSPAALEPRGGLLRKPSRDEINAYMTNKHVHIARANKGRSRLGTTAAELTHGELYEGEGAYELENP